MASPIEATPTLRGEDARRLIESLENRCSNEEAERRMAWAKKAMAEMMRPKKTKANADALAYIESRKQQDHELAKAVRVELDKLDEARERAANAALLKSEFARFEAASYRCKDQTSDLAGDARVMARNLVCSLKHGEFVKKAAIASAATLFDHIADTLDPAGQDHEEIT